MSAVADIFLLSPAHSAGARAQMLLRPESQSQTAVALRSRALTLGDAFSFMSGLYFRGKLAYAEAFGGALIITPTRGLMSASAIATLELLQEFAGVDIAAGEDRFRGPFMHDAHALRDRLKPGMRVVLLGSIATQKYVDALLEVFGDRLYFPTDFIGRGDMSRGALMLRAAASGQPLNYERVTSVANRRGQRPLKLAAAVKELRTLRHKPS